MSEKKAQNSFDEVSKTGEFERKPTSFHNKVSGEAGARYPPVAGRYVVYACLACPWANRVLAVRALKGLEHVIDVVYVRPEWGPVDPNGTESWVFEDTTIDGRSTSDQLYGLPHLRGLYELNDPEYAGRYTVPVFWDKETKTIVNNESSEIIRFLNNEFQALAKHPDVNLAPDALLSGIDEVNEWIYPTINNGVYRCGFASTQEAYEKAFEVLFGSLDRLETFLEGKRYLVGEQLTEADIRLFVTLIRFDPVYVGHFKCNKRTLCSYKNIWLYTRRLYSNEAIKSTISMEHIKRHYYGSHPSINPHRIVPAGPLIDYSLTDAEK